MIAEPALTLVSAVDLTWDPRDTQLIIDGDRGVAVLQWLENGHWCTLAEYSL